MSASDTQGIILFYNYLYTQVLYFDFAIAMQLHMLFCCFKYIYLTFDLLSLDCAPRQAGSSVVLAILRIWQPFVFALFIFPTSIMCMFWSARSRVSYETLGRGSRNTLIPPTKIEKFVVNNYYYFPGILSEKKQNSQKYEIKCEKVNLPLRFLSNNQNFFHFCSNPHKFWRQFS